MAGRIDRMPPCDVDAEKYVLGALMIDPAKMLEVAPVLRAEDFYRAAHTLYFDVIRSLHDAGRPVDTIEVSAELERRGKYREAGGDDYLAEIHDYAPHSLNILHHAHSVRQKAILRELITACAEIGQDAYTADADVDQILAAAEARIFGLSNLAVGTKGPASSAEVIAEARAQIEDRKGGLMAGVPTGITKLDHILGGCIGNGRVMIVAARPGAGKTGLALGFCEHAALQLDVPALMISLEMGKGELGERRIAAHANIDNRLLKDPRLINPAQWQRINSTDAVLSQAKFWVDDSPTRNMAQITAIARREKAFRQIGLLVIDYMQLIDGTGENDGRKSRQEVVAQISRRLKVLAKELDVPVVALSQLNRECEDRADKRPMLSDLRESGAIEQDADVVLLLHRPDYYDPDDQPGIAEIIVAKNRHGASGVIKARFIKEQARFANLADDREPDHRVTTCPEDAPF